MPKQLTQDEYLQRAKIIHGNKYDYSKVIYTNAHNKITITCPIHGDFTIKATNHTTQKQGCAKCSGNVPYTTSEYIIKCNKIHNNFYNYTKTKYITAHNKVTITCPIHGDFEQKAYVHLQGHNCPECAKNTVKEKAVSRPDIWSYTGWESAEITSNTFKAYTVYIVECWDKNERFIKIGKTFTSIHKRFTKGAIPYSWKVLYTITGSADYISRLEYLLHKRYKRLSYTPTTSFNGCNECYTLNLKDHIDFIKRRTTGDNSPRKGHT